MIPASKAKQLALDSEEHLNKILKLISPLIEETATKGGREFNTSGMSVPELQVDCATPSVKTQKLMDKIRSFGYNCSIRRSESKGYGLGFYDENEPPRINYSIVISW